MSVRRVGTGLGMAAALIAVTVAVSAATPPATPVPAEVVIAGMSHWFGPVTLSHTTHAEIAGDCITCHHHSDGEPVTCGTCHGERADLSEPNMPSLKVAFHEQCVGCHRVAGSGPTACEGCHARKTLPAGPPLKGGH